MSPIKELSKMLTEQVRKYPYLYDTTDFNYKNTHKREETWNEIANKLNITSNAARLKWKNLRDSYRRYKYTNCTIRKKKKFYCDMSFLDGWLKETPQTSESDAKTIKFEFASYENTDGDQLSNHSDLSPPSPTISHLSPPSPAISSRVKSPKIYAASYESMSPTFDSEVKNSSPAASLDTPTHDDFGLKSVLQPDNHRPLDATDHLFLSYAETFKTFQPATQVMVKLKLAQLFAKTELKELSAKKGKADDPSSSSSEEC